MDNKYNFIISAFISISIYVLFILLFVLYLKSPNVKTYQAVAKNTIIQLDIISDVKIKKDNKVKKSIKKIKKVEKVKIEKSASFTANKKSNLKSLFANVSTKSEKIEKKSVLNVQDNDKSSRFKSKIKKEETQKEIKIEKLNNNVTNVPSSKKILSNNKGDFDEYYSKISSIILTRWSQYPLLNTSSYLIKVKIKITSKGLFSYNILNNSGDLNIDDSLNEFLDSQVGEVYPLPVDGITKNIIINFKDEEKEN